MPILSSGNGGSNNNYPRPVDKMLGLLNLGDSCKFEVFIFTGGGGLQYNPDPILSDRFVLIPRDFPISLKVFT